MSKHRGTMACKCVISASNLQKCSCIPQKLYRDTIDFLRVYGCIDLVVKVSKEIIKCGKELFLPINILHEIIHEFSRRSNQLATWLSKCPIESRCYFVH